MRLSIEQDLAIHFDGGETRALLTAKGLDSQDADGSLEGEDLLVDVVGANLPALHNVGLHGSVDPVLRVSIP